MLDAAGVDDQRERAVWLQLGTAITVLTLADVT